MWYHYWRISQSSWRLTHHLIECIQESIYSPEMTTLSPVQSFLKTRVMTVMLLYWRCYSSLYICDVSFSDKTLICRDEAALLTFRNLESYRVSFYVPVPWEGNGKCFSRTDLMTAGTGFVASLSSKLVSDIGYRNKTDKRKGWPTLIGTLRWEGVEKHNSIRPYF